MGLRDSKHIISIVDSEQINFVYLDRNRQIDTVDSVPLDEFLSDRSGINTRHDFPDGMEDRLLIVPDYWFGNSIYQFQSQSRSLADAFVQRKVREQLPQENDAPLFFDFIHFQRESKENWLYVFFLKDPQFFNLYQKLVEINLPPHRITCGALIWRYILQETLADFEQGGKCLIQFHPKSYSLYFYFEGNFLFSRNIQLTSLSPDSDENYEAVAYELHQSIYLFSQKTGVDIDNFYMSSSDEIVIQTLPQRIGMEVEDLNPLIERFIDPHGTAEISLGAVGNFIYKHLLSQADFLSTYDKNLKRQLEWKSTQIAGIAIGLFLLIVLAAEFFLLHKLQHLPPQPADLVEAIIPTKELQQIQSYNDALDMLLVQMEEPYMPDLLSQIAKSLPDNIWMKAFEIDNEQDRRIRLQCVAESPESDHLKTTLSVLTTNLHQNLRLREKLRLEDIDFDFDPVHHKHIIKLEMDL